MSRRSCSTVWPISAGSRCRSPRPMAAAARIGPQLPKPKGLSLLLVDNTSPGLELRRTPTLARHILGTNEVYLHDVLVPRSRLVGPLDGGWQVLLSNLELEKILLS